MMDLEKAIRVLRDASDGASPTLDEAINTVINCARKDTINHHVIHVIEEGVQWAQETTDAEIRSNFVEYVAGAIDVANRLKEVLE